jgi:hypothetical protein
VVIDGPRPPADIATDFLLVTSEACQELQRICDLIGGPTNPEWGAQWDKLNCDYWTSLVCARPLPAGVAQ